MKTKNIALNKEKIIHSILEELFDNCYIDCLTGRFHCKRCNNAVYVNLSKKMVYCPVHGLLI